MYLPWPDKRLSPNARVHRMQKAAAKKEAREQAFYMAKKRYPYDPIGTSHDVELTVIFHPPDRRKRDLDNLYASFKPYQDGICDALGFDDSQIKSVTLGWGERVKGGGVAVMLETLRDSVKDLG